jgi:foldase protein PrsA
MKKQNLTLSQIRDDVRASVIQNKIYAKVTSGVTVSDKEIADYYSKNKSQYVQPESRDVRHILVKKKALADQIYQQLIHGANFAALAKKYSTDTSSKSSGGKMTISKGRQVPEFDKVAFKLKTHEIGKPVKTTYGWHVIQALTPIKPKSVTKLSEVKTAIRQQLLGQKKQQEMQKWVDDTTKSFKSKTNYQVGYEPPASTGSTSTGP